MFGDRWAPFFVANSLVQDQPDQPTLSMGNCPDGLIMSQARDRAAIHDLEDAAFGPDCGVGCLVEKASHVAVAFRRPVAVVDPGTLVIAGTRTNPRRKAFLGRKGRGARADFGNDLLR